MIHNHAILIAQARAAAARDVKRYGIEACKKRRYFASNIPFHVEYAEAYHQRVDEEARHVDAKALAVL